MMIQESVDPTQTTTATPTKAAGPSLEAIRQALPEEATDLKLNLQAVLSDGSLTLAQRYGVALSVAYASGNRALTHALEGAAESTVEAGALALVRVDARTAAAVMSMNNVFYRFRHLVGRPEYEKLPARLRMNRLAKPASSKIDLELFSLAVSAVNACETCVQSHERVLVGHGVTELQIHDAVRIAATVHAVAVVAAW